MIVVFLGPPASGKGTQAKKIAHKLNIPHISTGDMLRQEIQEKSELGNKIQQIINDGELVDDDTITKTVRHRINKNDCDNGFILDGFPRTIKQAQKLQNMLDNERKQLSAVLNIKVENDELIKRMNQRIKIEKNKRDDDNQKILEKRINIYQEQTQEIIQFYQDKKILHQIDGMKNILQVEQLIKECLQI